MIDIDKYEGHYGMTNEELLERFSNLSVDDYKELLAEVKRLRELKIAEEDELEELCNRAIFYEDEYKLSQRRMKELAELAEKQELLAENNRLREDLKRIRHTVFYDIEENFTEEQAYDPVLIEIMEKLNAVL